MALGTHPATGRARAYSIHAGLSTDTGTGTDLVSGVEPSGASSSTSRGPGTGDHRRRADVADGRRDRQPDAGQAGDIAIVDVRTPHLDGFADPVTTLVMGAGAADAETVVLAAEPTKHEGALLYPLAERARRLMHESRDRLRARVHGRSAAGA